MILRRIAAVIIIALGVAGLVLPVVPGVLLIALGALMYSGRDWRVLYRKLRASLKASKR